MKKKQPTVAEVLHYAADHCLAYNTRIDRKERFSCGAMINAWDRLNGDGAMLTQIHSGLKAMGCDVSSMGLFKKYGDMPHDYTNINPEVQGMRYMWLKWAALMAEEQGV
jgi:hypothetical protein